MNQFAALTICCKIFSHLTDDNNGNEKVKGTNKYVIKNLKSKDYKTYLKAVQLENNINQPENKVNVDSLKKVIKNNKLILKIQQRFKGITFLLEKLTRFH